MEGQHKRSNFSGSIGFVLAAAGSAVGLGNIWRFPYLAAKDGGGLFLLCYVILALTFGFALLTTEIAIGRKTGQSPLTAYGHMCSKFKWVGFLACLIPTIIMPYYSAIGGWILKYTFTYISGNGAQAVTDGFFTGFITSQWEPIFWFVIYLTITAIIVYSGVEKGIEKFSTILMPILLVLIIAISLFSLTLSHTDANGITRTGLDGLKVYVIPNFQGLTPVKFVTVVMDAMGQLFYSISVAMGIMITYGSYVKKETNLVKSVNQIEICDTAVAFLAGMMIIPAVFTFMGAEGMSSGPSLMFVSLPKVFEAMGSIGNVVGIAFFVMVAFAALTSSISLMETFLSIVQDKLHVGRITGTIGCTVFIIALGTLSCLGYGPLSHITIIGMAFLDFFDFATNSILMPIVAFFTCILIGHVLGTKFVSDEVEKNGVFKRKGLYEVMVRWVAPIILVVILAGELAKYFGIISI